MLEPDDLNYIGEIISPTEARHWCLVGERECLTRRAGEDGFTPAYCQELAPGHFRACIRNKHHKGPHMTIPANYVNIWLGTSEGHSEYVSLDRSKQFK